MKKNTLAALILTTLAAGQLASLQAHAAGQLNVWEDIKKSAGIKTAVSDFEKQYNVKVNLQEMPYAQQLEKLRLDGPAGIGPDVLVIPNDQLGGAVVQGLLSPLSVDQAKQDAFTPASINAFRMDNALYGIPKAVETLVLIYNKDLIDKPLDSLQAWLDYSKTQREQNKYGLLAKFDQIYYSWGRLARWAAISLLKTTAAALTRSRWVSIPRRRRSRHLPEKILCREGLSGGDPRR